MTDCHPTLPESMIMQTEALPAKHRNDRKKEALALEFEFLTFWGTERKKKKRVATDFFFLSYHIQGAHNVHLIGEKSTGKCFFRLLGWFYFFLFSMILSSSFCLFLLFLLLRVVEEICWIVIVSINPYYYLFLQLIKIVASSKTYKTQQSTISTSAKWIIVSHLGAAILQPSAAAGSQYLKTCMVRGRHTLSGDTFSVSE